MTLADKILRAKEDLDGVYSAGFAAGQEQGGGGGDTEAAYNEGFVDGKQAGTDEFWDGLQKNGSRMEYQSAFRQSGFTHIDPKWMIAPKGADNIMSESRSLRTVNWEKFNLSAVTSLYSAFAFCDVLIEVDTDIAVANPTGGTLLNSIFRGCYALQKVKKLTAYPSAVWKQSFENCTALTHIIFDGTIGANGLNLSWSTKLDKESITSIINALSTTTSGLSITLSQTAVNNAFFDGTAEDFNPSAWDDLIGQKDNWTINLL